MKNKSDFWRRFRSGFLIKWQEPEILLFCLFDIIDRSKIKLIFLQVLPLLNEVTGRYLYCTSSTATRNTKIFYFSLRLSLTMLEFIFFTYLSISSSVKALKLLASPVSILSPSPSVTLKPLPLLLFNIIYMLQLIKILRFSKPFLWHSQRSEFLLNRFQVVSYPHLIKTLLKNKSPAPRALFFYFHLL